MQYLRGRLGVGARRPKVRPSSPQARRDPLAPSTIIADMSRESKGPYPSGDFTLPQLLYMTKTKLQEITAGVRYVQTVPVTLVLTQNSTVQDYNNSKRG